MTTEAKVYAYPLALATVTFFGCLAMAHATPFTGLEIEPLSHPNFLVQLGPNRSNFTGITVPQLARQFPTLNFAFDGPLIGYFGSLNFPSQQVVWTTPLVDVQPDPEPVALAYKLPVYAPAHEPFHPHEPLVGVPEPATWLLVLLGIGLVWVACALMSKK